MRNRNVNALYLTGRLAMLAIFGTGCLPADATRPPRQVLQEMCKEDRQSPIDIYISDPRDEWATRLWARENSGDCGITQVNTKVVPQAPGRTGDVVDGRRIIVFSPPQS